MIVQTLFDTTSPETIDEFNFLEINRNCAVVYVDFHVHVEVDHEKLHFVVMELQEAAVRVQKILAPLTVFTEIGYN